MDKIHNSYFFLTGISSLNLKFIFHLLISLISSHEIKEQKHTFSKLPLIYLFDHVVHRFDLIWLCHVITDTENVTLEGDMLSCKIRVKVLQ